MMPGPAKAVARLPDGGRWQNHELSEFRTSKRCLQGRVPPEAAYLILLKRLTPSFGSFSR
jgi:hypothetical protein